MHLQSHRKKTVSSTPFQYQLSLSSVATTVYCRKKSTPISNMHISIKIVGTSYNSLTSGIQIFFTNGGYVRSHAFLRLRKTREPLTASFLYKQNLLFENKKNNNNNCTRHTSAFESRKARSAVHS